MRAEAVRHGAPKIDARPTARNPSSRSSFTRTPGEPGKRSGALGGFSWREGGEVFLSQECQITPGRNGSVLSWCDTILSAGSSVVFQIRKRKGRFELHPPARIGSRRTCEIVLVVRAPESLECTIENLELLVAMKQKRAACVVDIASLAKVHVPERLNHVEQTARMDVDADATQGTAKLQQV
jgi:hypothetical protein